MNTMPIEEYYNNINNVKNILFNAYISLHKKNRTDRTIRRYSKIISKCQDTIRHDIFMINFIIKYE